MNYRQQLIHRARRFLEIRRELPMDLILDMQSQGMNVSDIERTYYGKSIHEVPTTHV